MPSEDLFYREVEIERLENLKPEELESIMPRLRGMVEAYSELQEYSRPLTINPNGRRKYVIARWKGRVIGFSIYTVNHSKRIISRWDTFVSPDFRRRGVQTKISNWYLHRARGLGRYSIFINWLDPDTSLHTIRNFGKRMKKAHKRSKGRRRRFFSMGLRAHPLSKFAREYIKDDYGDGVSFEAGLEKYREEYADPIFRKGRPRRVSDSWIQMRQLRGRKVPGPQRMGKSLFRPKKGIRRRR